MLRRRYLTLLLALLLPAAVCAGDLEIYFSPNGGCMKKVVELIDGSRETIDIAVYSFTSRPIAQALVRAHERGIKIRVLMDKVQGSGKYSKAVFLSKKGIPVRLDTKSGLMHNKLAVFDGKVAVTGSFNWTASAEKKNQENLVVIHDPKIISAIEVRIHHLWKLNKDGEVPPHR